MTEFIVFDNIALAVDKIIAIEEPKRGGARFRLLEGYEYTTRTPFKTIIERLSREEVKTYARNDGNREGSVTETRGPNA